MVLLVRSLEGHVFLALQSHVDWEIAIICDSPPHVGEEEGLVCEGQVVAKSLFHLKMGSSILPTLGQRRHFIIFKIFFSYCNINSYSL